MDDISNTVNFNVNENRPILDNRNVNSIDTLKENAENKLSAVESPSLFQNSPLTEKQLLTNVNNNCQNVKENSNFALLECSATIVSNNFEENITALPQEAGTTVDMINNLNFACETDTVVENGKNLSENLSSGEIPTGNVNIRPDALSEKNYDIPINNAEHCNEICISKLENNPGSIDTEESKDEKNNSYKIVDDLVEFSFSDQNNYPVLPESCVVVDSVSEHPVTSPTSILENSSGIDSTGNNRDIFSMTALAELFETNCAVAGSNEQTAIDHTDSMIANPFKEKNLMEGSCHTDSALSMSENPEKKVVNNMVADDACLEIKQTCKTTVEVSQVEPINAGIFAGKYSGVKDSETALQVPENPINEAVEFSPLNVEKVSFEMSDKTFEQFSDPDFIFKSPGNLSSNEQVEVSPLKVEKVSLDMSDKPEMQFSESDFALGLPEMPSCNVQDQLSPFKVENNFLDNSDKVPEQNSEPDFVFKVPEVPFTSPLGQFQDPDFALKGSEKTSTNDNDEQFVDAVQFFKDANSFQFLENIRTSVQSGSPVPRSSLYVNFDPLHSKIQANAARPDNCELISAAVQENNASIEKCPKIVNKQLVDVEAHESLGNILISFDSPKATTCVDSNIPTHSPPKMYTEEEFQQKLKILELETQEAYLKKQREMEMEVAKRDKLLKSQHLVIEEFCGISIQLSADIRKNEEKVTSLEEENEKLKEDIKTSAEDLQSVENTFTDFYKRYEQCKGMLKTYKDNEEHLKQTILDLQAKAKEQEQMYNMLQERTEEMLEKANVEVDNAKRSGEAQVTVLKAQLKKAEMKISSLESDIKQIKIENSQLDDICGDLMAKVSRS